MKKRWMKMAAALCATAVFGGCGASMEEAGTVVAETGFRSNLSCAPPVEKTFTMDEETIVLLHAGSQTAALGLEQGTLTDVRPRATIEIYTDGGWNILRMDDHGRIIGLQADILRESGWIAADTTEDGLMEVLEKVAVQVDVDLARYPDIELYGGCQLRLYQDIDSPYTDYIHAEFDETGKFCFVKIHYSNIISLSEEDEAYFAGLLAESIGSDTPYTVSTAYFAEGGVLAASYTVTYSDPKKGVWVENYTAGKSLS